MGVLLGDGFFGKNKNGTHAYLMLKSVDKDFVVKFKETVSAITGKEYSIYTRDPKKKNWNVLHICKCYDPELVAEFKDMTRNKTVVPNSILDGEENTQIAFLQGLMDSEGWISVQLRPMKQSQITLAFANTSSWTKDVWHLFRKLGIEVSKLYRSSKPNKKELYWFKINIVDYLKKGLSFNIERKRNRLEFVSRILNDFTCNYGKDAYKRPVEDKV